MSSRDKILSAIEANQPPRRELPTLPSVVSTRTDLDAQFVAVLESIGGGAYFVSGYDRIATILREQFPQAHRIVSNCPQLPFDHTPPISSDPHTLEDIDLAILPAHFGVAENGACWVTETQMLHRALPFIAQHLALVIHRRDIVADMHQAYDRIARLDAVEALANPSDRRRPSALGARPISVALYGFATFIAGPSKTADIEQSLVLGAHGPMSLTVFLLDEQLSDAGFY